MQIYMYILMLPKLGLALFPTCFLHVLYLLILGSNSFYPYEVLGVFQFEFKCLKIGNIPPNVSKNFNLDLPLLIFV
jgi:hypothetical protein